MQLIYLRKEKGDFNSLETWTHANLMRFSKAKHKVLQMGCSNSHCLYRLGDDLAESSSAKGLGATGALKNST